MRKISSIYAATLSLPDILWQPLERKDALVMKASNYESLIRLTD